MVAKNKSWALVLLLVPMAVLAPVPGLVLALELVPVLVPVLALELVLMLSHHMPQKKG